MHISDWSSDVCSSDLLGFDGYEAMRAVYRDWLAQGAGSFAQRATALQQRGTRDKTESLVRELVHADSGNLQSVLEPAELDAIRAATDSLGAARPICVAGLRSLLPAASYLNLTVCIITCQTQLLA